MIMGFDESNLRIKYNLLLAQLLLNKLLGTLFYREKWKESARNFMFIDSQQWVVCTNDGNYNAVCLSINIAQQVKSLQKNEKVKSGIVYVMVWLQLLAKKAAIVWLWLVHHHLLQQQRQEPRISTSTYQNRQPWDQVVVLK